MLYDNGCSYLCVLMCHKLKSTPSLYMENDCNTLALNLILVWLNTSTKHWMIYSAMYEYQHIDNYNPGSFHVKSPNGLNPTLSEFNEIWHTCWFQPSNLTSKIFRWSDDRFPRYEERSNKVFATKPNSQILTMKTPSFSVLSFFLSIKATVGMLYAVATLVSTWERTMICVESEDQILHHGCSEEAFEPWPPKYVI